MQQIYNQSHVTKPNFISSVYFNFIYKQIIKQLNFDSKKVILDFGSGLGYLKKKIGNKYNLEIINYDIVEELSDVKNWKDVKFDIIIFSQVLYLFSPNEFKELFLQLKKHNSDLIIICAFSTQSFINKIGKYLLGHKDAHEGTRISPKEEEMLLLSFCEPIESKNFLNIFKLFKLKFKKI
jgi:hypothetical protein